jgi:diguanylate cyclase
MSDTDQAPASDPALTVAQKAFDAMRARSVTASPKAFEVWHAHFSGSHPSLSAEIHSRLARAPRLEDAEITALHDIHLGNNREVRQAERTSANVLTEIDGVMAIIDRAMGSNTRYEESLSMISANLEGITNRDDVRSVVETLVTATQSASSDNRYLEAKLAESRGEIQELREALEATRAEALTDPLTGLANRRHFDEMLQKTIDQSTVRREPFALALIDIDHFKRFNDEHGHQTGDMVLRLVARTIKQKFKASAICARYGGEEFAVIMPASDIVAGRIGAETARQGLLSRELVKKSTGQSLGRITISIGVTAFRKGDLASAIIERADVCLLTAKRQGRNRTVIDARTDEIQNVA